MSFFHARVIRLLSDATRCHLWTEAHRGWFLPYRCPLLSENSFFIGTLNATDFLLKFRAVCACTNLQFTEPPTQPISKTQLSPTPKTSSILPLLRARAKAIGARNRTSIPNPWSTCERVVEGTSTACRDWYSPPHTGRGSQHH